MALYIENLELRGHFVYSILIYLKYFEYLKETENDHNGTQYIKKYIISHVSSTNFQGAIIAMAPKKAGGLHFQDATMQYKYKYNRLRQVVGR